MESRSTLVPLAQVLGLSGAGILTGLSTSFSSIGIPIIALAPDDLIARQWRTMYEIGVATMPPFAVGCAICFGFLAVKTRQLRGRFPGWRFDPTAPSTLYAAAAILVPAIVPYTLAVMVPTNDRLMAKAKGLGNMGLQETRVLVEKWKGMNYVRAAMAGVATLLAGWATVVR